MRYEVISVPSHGANGNTAMLLETESLEEAERFIEQKRIQSSGMSGIYSEHANAIRGYCTPGGNSREVLLMDWSLEK